MIFLQFNFHIKLERIYESRSGKANLRHAYWGFGKGSEQLILLTKKKIIYVLVLG